ncbi:sigma-70-like protein [Nonomuraea polychroma]|uniref:Sigma-70-like protein n=1 Tax=Nonomuraea polychroma TaxID=46176 RepID=A0A438M8C9_9ACTN|nr:sigma-70-like protein [Nonomuraea polychroma]
MDSTATDRFDTSRFEASRNRLTSLAHRLLGSAADAEDAVQDAFLHWQAADRQRIKVPEAWLTKVVTNLCLDRLRSAQARRERTVGVWLPERSSTTSVQTSIRSPGSQSCRTVPSAPPAITRSAQRIARQGETTAQEGLSSDRCISILT